MFLVAGLLVLLELSGPVVAETRLVGTPWHGHHIAERYGLMVIIALGEGLLGTTAALGALIEDGWTTEIVVLGLSGVALTFGVWWTYFVIPHGHLLSAHRERSFGWGYWHIPLFGSVVAIGAGLHTAAYYLEDHSELTATGTVLTLVVPLAVYFGILFLLYALITRTMDPFHFLLIGLSAGVMALSIGMACVRGLDGLVPGRARAGAVGDRRGLRDRRPPAQRRGAGGARGGADRLIGPCR